MYVNTIVLYASDGKGLLPYAYVSENIRSSGNKALIITIIIHKMYACTIDDHKVLPIRGASRCTIQIHVYLARRRRRRRKKTGPYYVFVQIYSLLTAHCNNFVHILYLRITLSRCV